MSATGARTEITAPAGEAPTAQSLRSAFDASFGRPSPQPEGKRAQFVCLRIDHERYALSLAEMAGFERARPVVPFPFGRTELLGLAGRVGKPVAVYSLARLLGHERPEPEIRWFASTAGRLGCSLAFGNFEGHVSAAPADIQPIRGGAPPFVHHVLAGGAGPVFIVDIPELLGNLRSGETRHQETQE